MTRDLIKYQTPLSSTLPLLQSLDSLLLVIAVCPHEDQEKKSLLLLNGDMMKICVPFVIFDEGRADFGLGIYTYSLSWKAGTLFGRI